MHSVAFLYRHWRSLVLVIPGLFFAFTIFPSKSIMNVMKKFTFLSIFFTLTVILFSCKPMDNSDDEIVDTWNRTNTTLIEHLLPNIELKKDIYPTQEQLLISAEAITSYRNFLFRQKYSKDSNNGYISIDNKEILEKLISLSNSILNNMNLLSTASFQKNTDYRKELYIEIQKNIYFIMDNMFKLEHNCSKAFKTDIFIYINSLLFTIVIILMLITIIILKLLADSKKQTLQLEESKDYVTYVLMAQEQERMRLSRELHDTVAQDLRSIFSITSSLSDIKISTELKNKQNECLNQIRSICYNLLPPDLDEKDIRLALQEFMQDFSKKSGIEARLAIVDDVDFSIFSKDELLNMYRIVQESLANIEKHSKASEATVLFRLASEKNNLDQKNTHLVIIISDDGKGMSEHLLSRINSNKNESIVKGHFGIKNTKERVFLLNGQIKYSSFQDCGTEIKIQIPLK